MAEQLEQTNQPTNITPEQERAELDKYRKDLIGVHNQLKSQADLLTALKGYGINSVTDLSQKMGAGSMQKTSEELASDEAESINTGNMSEVDELKGEVEQLRDQVSQQNQRLADQDMTIRSDRLQSQIMDQVKGKPEFALLEKALDPNITRNIMAQIQRDQQEGKGNFDLPHYLQMAEKNLRSFYTKLGGSLEQKPAGNVLQPGQATPSVQVPAQPEAQPQATNTNTPPAPQAKPPGETINFPSLPSHSSGSNQSVNTPKDAYDKYLEKGRDPVTGITDENRAFEAELSEYASEGYPTE